MNYADTPFAGRSVTDLDAERAQLERRLDRADLVEITPEAVQQMLARLELIRAEVRAMGEMGT